MFIIYFHWFIGQISSHRYVKSPLFSRQLQSGPWDYRAAGASVNRSNTWDIPWHQWQYPKYLLDDTCEQRSYPIE